MIPESFKKKRDEALVNHTKKWAHEHDVNVKFDFISGADFGYLEGRDAMAKEIVEWLRSETADWIEWINEDGWLGTSKHNKSGILMNSQRWSDAIERRFLNKEEDNESNT